MIRKVVFVLLQKTHLLDLSGPAQVFYEANQIGDLGIEVTFCSLNKQCVTEQGLQLSNLVNPQEIYLTPGDFIVVPGVDFAAFQRNEPDDEIFQLTPWLRAMDNNRVNIASICSGSLVLAKAGILDGRQCTSHWKCLDYMARSFAKIKILKDRIFVKDQNIYTSAGMTSGMDMSLAILEEFYGPLLTAKVAREMVIFLRRDDGHSQESIYLSYQTHFNAAIHQVQNHIISNPDKNPTLKELADIANMSERNLTRTFKEVTGRTITEFKHATKIDLVKTYLHNPDLPIVAIADRCGFSNTRHLRRVWKEHIGKSLSETRQEITNRSVSGLKAVQ